MAGNFNKLALVAFEILIPRLINRQSIFYRLAILSMVFLGAALIPTLWDAVINRLFDLASESSSCESTSLTLIVFSSILFTSLTFIFSFLSHKYSNTKEVLINSVKKEEWVSISNSKIHTYTGSILQISDIDVIVTSENTSLSLGSINGTSVSGRVRRLAASYNSDLTLHRDNLLESIDGWKSEQPNKGPYQKGMIILSPPFQAMHNGVKSIVNAIAVEKTSDGEHLIDADAIRNILRSSIEHCKTNGYKSIFIPIFGLGSGGNDKKTAIFSTLDPLIDTLKNEDYALNVYIGVYRLKDLLLAGKHLIRHGV